MKILFVAVVCIILATPAVAIEHSPDDHGLRGGSVDRGGSQRDDRGRNAEPGDAHGSDWSGKSYGDGRR